MTHTSTLILRVKTLQDALAKIAAKSNTRLTADAEYFSRIAETALAARTADPLTEESLDAAVSVILQHKTVNVLNSILKAKGSL